MRGAHQPTTSDSTMRWITSRTTGSSTDCHDLSAHVHHRAQAWVNPPRDLASRLAQDRLWCMTSPPAPLSPTLLAAIAARVGPEWMAWYALSPAQRWEESARLWPSFAALGGSLDSVADYELARGARGSRGVQPGS
jgi:hypothetical protein